MKLTPGKLAGLQRVSDKRGVIAAAAMDQRGSLQKSLAKEKGGEVNVRVQMRGGQSSDAACKRDSARSGVGVACV